MKKILFFIFSLNFAILFAQNDDPLMTNEISFGNQTNQTIYIRIYPISMVFNHWYNYDMKSVVSTNSTANFDYINGVSLGTNNNTINYITVPSNSVGEYGWGHEHEGNEGQYGNIGYGDYKIEFSTNNSFTNIFDSLILQYDYMIHVGDYEGEEIHDLSISYKSNSTDDGIKWFTYKWQGNCPEANFPSNRRIQHWNRCNISGEYRTKQMGPFIYDDSHSNTYTYYPHDYQKDCVDQNIMDNIFNNRYGLLTLDLIVKKNIYARDLDISNPPARMFIGTGTNFTLDNSVTFDMIKNGNWNPYNNYYNIFTVQSNANLFLNSNSTFLFRETNWFVLDKNSNFYLNSGSVLGMYRGSYFCNRGANIHNNGRITIKGNVCADPTPDSPVHISGNGTFEVDSTEFYIPDSTSYTFDSNAVFLCKPFTKIIFGKNSKLIFENGSRINADNCTFVSYDSTQTWDGIYLDGIAYDTLKNCTFQNAVNGINITDNYNPFGAPGAVEISNCTFKNSTSSDLLNYVYVNNSYNVLVKGCNSVNTGSGGYTSGIIAEYCPTNGVVIADNNINYVTTGISLLQSSEYIGRNTITGSTNSGTGIYLDNSNGTIEYNTVNNFQKSVYGSYSSPYMLKNTFYDASLTNIDLVDGSMPVMKPVISSSTLRWLGGNNTISGFPSNSGIRFADCYPLMDSGYNKIVVNGSDYMNGNFTFSITTVPARLNYWFDSPPISSLFNISSGNVNSSNPFNGSSLPSTDGTELNSLGWGMYDTVFTKSLGDNSTPEDLFMQAYTEEMSQNYTDAITYYKEVVSSYKTSSLSPVSLSRIFNCLEKSHASSSDFQTIQSYYSSIKTNSVYPNESRELSEDFVIKSKVKQGSIEDAVSDYNAIYQANQNNSKGLHALLNKYCLENMIQGDNSTSGNTNFENHKINILTLITGENIKSNNFSNNNTPKQFRLLQNYPNPFNPLTNIKYEIPKDVNVTIKIYDILGKEVFSYNEYKKAGSYEVMFDGTNLASGMYFYKLETEGFTDTKKMVLLK